MTDINLKTLTPDTSLPTTGFLFGADSQATASPSVYGVTTAITTILGNAASSDALVFNSDTTFSRGAIRNFRFGAADAATALAQTLSVQSVVAGTSNTAGAAFTITGSQGTGTGAGGSLIFQVAPAGISGTAQNALSTALTIAPTQISSGFPFSITTSVGAGAASFVVQNNTSSGGYSTGIDILSPSMVAGDLQTTLRFGRNLSTYNIGYVSFLYVGNGSASNAIRFEFQAGPSLAFTAGGLFQFLGATSSFPALKRSSTTLQARLADDSAFASVQGKLTTDTAYTAGALVPTGYITIYDSTGTAYRVPCLV